MDLSGLLDKSLGPGGSFSNTPTSGASASANFVPPVNTTQAINGNTQTVNAPGPSNTGPVSNAPANPAPSGGGNNSGRDPHINPATGQWDDNYYAKNNQPSLEDQIKNSINSGYASYFGQLDDMLNTLPGQRSNMEGTVKNSYDQSVGDLNTQGGVANSQLDAEGKTVNANQAQNLRDLADNIGNLMQAGNVYLGTKGAADSSAANQYSYALTKLGSQQAGNIKTNANNIQDQINSRKDQINQVMTNELNRLSTEKNNNLLQVAQWFADQQNSIGKAKAEGALNQGKDLASVSTTLLNAALQHLNNIDLAFQNQSSALRQWAAYNSQNVGQLASNIRAVSAYAPELTGYSSMNPTPNGGSGENNPASVGYGYGTNNEKDLLHAIYGSGASV